MKVDSRSGVQRYSPLCDCTSIKMIATPVHNGRILFRTSKRTVVAAEIIFPLGKRGSAKQTQMQKCNRVSRNSQVF